MAIYSESRLPEAFGRVLVKGQNVERFEIPVGVVRIFGYAFSNCKKLKSVKIPNTVKMIDMYAFEGCSALTSIWIPFSVKSIDWRFFNDCANLKEIHITNDNPNTIDVEFLEEDINNVTLFVPIGTGYAYHHHPEFSKFKELKIERCTIYGDK